MNKTLSLTLDLNTKAHQLREAARLLMRALGVLRHPYSQLGLHLSQCHALVEIGNNPELNIIRLADVLYLERSTVSRLIAQLKKQGFVLYLADAADKRSKLLGLTEKGKLFLEQVHEENNAKVRPAVEQLSEKEYEHVIMGMRLYARILTENKKQ